MPFYDVTEQAKQPFVAENDQGTRTQKLVHA